MDNALNTRKVLQRQEILDILRQLAENRKTLYCHENEVDRFIAFQTLHATESAITLLPLGDQQLHRQLATSSQMQLWTRQDGVRISFEVERIGRHSAPTLFVSLPRTLTLCQQRRTLRTLPSYAQPLSCRLHDHADSPITIQVSDISLEGIGLVCDDPAEDLRWHQGKYLNDCRLGLGLHGELSVTLRLCHVSKRLSEGGSLQLHAGAEFIEPSPELHQHISLYRHEVELSRQRYRWCIPLHA